MKRQIKYVANAIKWFDRVNGNTYHSVQITRTRDSKTIYCPYQYGYGDQYRQTVLEAMAKEKWLPVQYRGRYANRMPKDIMYERENNYPIMWNVSHGLKRECIANGKEA